jgi:hypothetical protein
MLHESGINMGDFADIDGNIGYDSGHKYGLSGNLSGW